MKRTVMLLTTLLVLAGAAPYRSPSQEAAALLLDIEDLCIRIGREIPAAGRKSPEAQAALALAEETLTITEELLWRVQRRSAQRALLAEVLDLERQMCGEARAARNPRSLEPDLREAARRLEAAVRLDESYRQEILLRFLDRRDEAISDRLESVVRTTDLPVASTMPSVPLPKGGSAVAGRPRRRWVPDRAPPRESLSPGQPASEHRLDVPHQSESEPADVLSIVESTAVQEGGLARGHDGAGSDLLAAAAGGARESEQDRPDSAEPVQIYDPPPSELARRRNERVSALRARLASWGPACRRELQELATIRSALTRELRVRSLEHVGPLCVRLAEAANGIDYEIVLQAPDVHLRQSLDRMLGRYATAGSWCASEQYAFAWIEIEKADRHWRRLVEQLRRLSKG